MGRYKAEMIKVHRKKVRKAKEKVKSYLKGESSYEGLTQLAKHLLRKRKKQEAKPT